jgi:DNA mismatch repair ATPase MutS
MWIIYFLQILIAILETFIHTSSVSLETKSLVIDLKLFWSDREIEIIQTLLEKALVYEDTIIKTCEKCAELDCLLSFAEAARAYNYVRPEMTHENIIDISQGRSVIFSMRPIFEY